MHNHTYSIKTLTPSSGNDIWITFRKSVIFEDVLKNKINTMHK